MNKKPFTIKNGLYLVVDPSMYPTVLYEKIVAALKGGVDIIQIWNHFASGVDKKSVINAIVSLAHQYNVPVLINEDFDCIDLVDGIHFDEIPVDFDNIQSIINADSIIGITCGNDFEKIEWAVANQLDYLSFCSVFPSKSVNTCELVSREIIQRARAFTQMPIFLSGGIGIDNLPLLKDTGLDGIAVISGIMNAEEPTTAALEYKQALINLNNNNNNN